MCVCLCVCVCVCVCTGDHSATLELSIPSTGEKNTYRLTGRAAEPVAESHIVLECQARTPVAKTIAVRHVLGEHNTSLFTPCAREHPVRTRASLFKSMCRVFHLPFAHHLLSQHRHPEVWRVSHCDYVIVGAQCCGGSGRVRGALHTGLCGWSLHCQDDLLTGYIVQGMHAHTHAHTRTRTHKTCGMGIHMLAWSEECMYS